MSNRCKKCGNYIKWPWYTFFVMEELKKMQTCKCNKNREQKEGEQK